jgi:uncharacterized protein (DUF697 family)
MNDTKIIEKIKSELERNITAIEAREDLSTDEKVSRIIHSFCAVCSAIAIQPIPFADIFILTPIQAYMGSRLAAIHGVPVEEATVKNNIADLLKVAGMGLVAQQLAIGAYKTGLPFMGGFMTIPLVYGLTYAIGNVLNVMFKARSKGKELSDEEKKRLFREMLKEGKRKGKENRERIKEQASQD